MTVCKVCDRQHGVDQPCPRRLANAMTMQAQALERLTKADMDWVNQHPNFSVLDTVEDAIADLMSMASMLGNI